MGSERNLLENADSAQNAEDIIFSLGHIDEYSSEDSKKYSDALSELKTLATDSILAATLIDIDTHGAISRQTDRITAARDVVDQVQKLDANLTDDNEDVALVAAKDRIAIFDSDENVDIRFSYQASRHSTTLPSASLIIKPMLVTFGNTFGGSLHDLIEKSDYDPDTGWHFGGTGLVVPFHTVHEGVHPFGEIRLPALTLGRKAISDLYADIALNESARFSTHHRSRMGSFALWRLRDQDDQLSTDIDQITDQFGLKDIWAGQHRDELAAKVAHAIKADFAAENRSFDMLTDIYLKDTGFNFLSQDTDLFVPSEQELRYAIDVQLSRLGIEANDLQIATAVEFVWANHQHTET